MAKTCPQCRGTNLETSSNGELVCNLCGVVVEENRIVSEVTFGETSSGRPVVQGSFMAVDQSTAVSSGGPHRNNGDSRFQTLERAKLKLAQLAAALGIKENVYMMGHQFYKLALQQNFVKGRKSKYVISACLYLACRKSETPHMLMDFSAAIFANVFKIGNTYLQLVKALLVTNIPLLDPSLFIRRFVGRLDFGDEGSKRVASDALKILQRMGKDWITQGRRPAGVAAACVLLAARMNNFRRSRYQVVALFKVGEDTLQRRLNEFSSTQSAAVSVSDFRTNDLANSEEPPSFKRNRERERLQALADHQSNNMFEDNRTGKPTIVDQLLDVNESNETATAEQQIDAEEMKAASAQDKETWRDIDETLHDPAMIRAAKQTLEVVEARKLNPEREKTELMSDDLEDVDDEEIEEVILKPEEAKLKSQVWHAINKDYILRQHELELKVKSEQKSGHSRGPRKRKAASTHSQPRAPSVSADDSVQQMLRMKPQSKKLNHRAFQHLFGPTPSAVDQKAAGPPKVE